MNILANSVRLAVLATLVSYAPAIFVMASDLKSADPAVRMKACQAIGNARDKAQVPALIDALKDKSEGVRINAVVSLGYFRDSRSIPPLLELAAKDKNSAVRVMAAQSLGRFNDAKVTAALNGLLDDKDAGVRASAAGALGRKGEQNMQKLLKKAENDPDGLVRKVSTDILAETADEGNVPEADRPAMDRVLRKAAAGADAKSKAAAERALKRLERKAQKEGKGK